MNTVLIVDDDRDLLTIYKQTLLNASFVVDAINNIPEAEDLAETKKYDLIILDLLFAEIDTLSTIRRIRNKTSINSKTPILILTNLDSGEKTRKALEYGANECLFKATQTPKSISEIALKVVNDTGAVT